jgi:hypothetical protein
MLGFFYLSAAADESLRILGLAFIFLILLLEVIDKIKNQPVHQHTVEIMTLL